MERGRRRREEIRIVRASCRSAQAETRPLRIKCFCTSALAAAGAIRHPRCEEPGKTERKPAREESPDEDENVTGRDRPPEGRDKSTETRNTHRPDPGQFQRKKKKENTMFARNAARTFALALGLVALLATASSAPAADTAASAPAPAKKTVNVNTASADELARLPRVGPSLAGRIVSHRDQNGPFKRTEDLMEVKGIGEKMFTLLKPHVAVAGPTTLTEKLSSKGTTPKAAPKAKAAAPAEKTGK
ncbi:MAG: helix-hairpin-helix domain-containing protein [Deltaproteobacteria bacterium]|nr:helix-hairpin-helix domain-containing protein [Deltaproteobacteria bacterium]